MPIRFRAGSITSSRRGTSCLCASPGITSSGRPPTPIRRRSIPHWASPTSIISGTRWFHIAIDRTKAADRRRAWNDWRYQMRPFGSGVRQFHTKIRSGIGPASRRQTVVGGRRIQRPRERTSCRGCIGLRKIGWTITRFEGGGFLWRPANEEASFWSCATCAATCASFRGPHRPLNPLLHQRGGALTFS